MKKSNLEEVEVKLYTPDGVAEVTSPVSSVLIAVDAFLLLTPFLFGDPMLALRWTLVSPFSV